jgi:Signal transduction histidine kinase regulating citrate/malate metabolism
MTMENLLAWMASHYFVTFVDEWLACFTYLLLSHRAFRGPRLALKSGLMAVAIGLALWVSWYLTKAGVFKGRWWIFSRVMVYLALMYVMIRLCSSESRSNALYLCMRAFLLAEFSWSICWGIVRSWEARGTVPLAQQQGMFLVVSPCLCCAIYLLERLFMTTTDPMRIDGSELSIVFLTSMLVFIMTTFLISTGTTFFGMKFEFAHALIDFLGMLFLFMYRLSFMNQQKREEIGVMRQAMEAQHIQYRQARENMEAIGRKYHDIKYVIALLRSETGDAQVQELKEHWIRDMEQDMHVYEALSDTGNRVLDALLTEKQLSCKRKDINFWCVVDGTQLDGMDALDIWTVFGNALDNAIESVEKIEEPERRIIHATVGRKQGFLLVSFENLCDVPPLFSNGLPVSTKGDAPYHGYGLKSVQFVVASYGGEAAVDWRYGWFRLNLLLPLPLRRGGVRGIE